MNAEWVLAHGVGARADLPIPLSLALMGGATALLVSFAALGLLWPWFRPVTQTVSSMSQMTPLSAESTATCTTAVVDRAPTVSVASTAPWSAWRPA